MTRPGPGKFEGNPSLEASEILYQHVLDNSHDNVGEQDTFGFYTLIMQHSLTGTERTVCDAAAYICEDDSQGFFTYTPYSDVQEAVRVWGNLLNEWTTFNSVEDAEGIL